MKTKSEIIRIRLSKHQWKLIYEQLKMAADMTSRVGRFRSNDLEMLTDIAYQQSKGMLCNIDRNSWKSLISCLSIQRGLPITCDEIRRHLDGEPCQPKSDDAERRDELGLSPGYAVMVARRPITAGQALTNRDVMSLAEYRLQRRLKLFAWGLLAGSILAIWVLVL